MQKILAFLMIFSLLTLPVYVQAAEQPVKVKVNGAEVKFPDAQPYIDPANKRTMIPIRFVSEELGSHVSWNQKTQVVSMMRAENQTLSIFLKIGENQANVNGVVKKFDAKAVLKNNRTFVPLRFVSETLGAKVEWNEAERTVAISTTTKDSTIKPPVTGTPANPAQRPGQAENVEALKRMAAGFVVENDVLKGTVPSDVTGYALVQFKGENGKVVKTKYMQPGESFELKLTDAKGGIGIAGQNGTAFGSVGIEYPSMEIVSGQ